ncbi:hypothetical protein BEH_24645 (plasmid) [Priestia filamentosa]|uniref:RiboL-PSP-HEPN domain-containing protein n=1 Tax=Priestia filamentosa TaxID=1402861 RepID=A0A2S1M0J2_9BACI|nr:hypothetical protein [Priestia filamentosa]AWG44890.1 hypothetical protein BEH_24645 [Priestia filamentosa]
MLGNGAFFRNNVQSFFISYELNLFRDYVKYIENTLQQELKTYEDGIKELQEEEVDDYIDEYLDNLIQYSYDFPTLMRKSLFVSIYTFLEDKMVDLCVPTDNTLLNLNDIQGKGIEQASVYLKKVLRLDFPDSGKEWHYIKKANLIRNCIVHANGNVSKSTSQKKLRNIINDMPSITIDKSDHIRLDSNFCLDFVENVGAFLRQLYKIEN